MSHSLVHQMELNHLSSILDQHPGVTFTQPNASVIIRFAPGITPIIVEVSVPNTNTNVKQITVIITAPNGTIIGQPVSSSGTNNVTQLPLTPLPENSTLTITFETNDNHPPANVTISVIACYTPSTATTIVTSGYNCAISDCIDINVNDQFHNNLGDNRHRYDYPCPSIITLFL